MGHPRFQVGDMVLVTDGSFENFSGVIVEINAEAGSAVVCVELFGRRVEPEIPLRHLRKDDDPPPLPSRRNPPPG